MSYIDKIAGDRMNPTLRTTSFCVLALIVAATLGCQHSKAQKRKEAAARDLNAAIRAYEHCLAMRQSDCRMEREMMSARDARYGLAVREYSMEVEEQRQTNEAWSAAAAAINETNEAQRRDQREKESLELERRKQRRLQPQPPRKRRKSIDYTCMTDCQRRYSYSYCTSACSY